MVHCVATTSFWPSGWNGIEGKTELLPLTTILLIVVTISTIILKIKRELRLPPGPPSLPVLGYLPFLGPDLHRSFAQLAQTYGPIMRIQLGSKLCVVVSSPAAAMEVLKDQDATFANRDVLAAARAIMYGGRDIVWMSYGPAWRELRKFCVRELLNAKRINEFYTVHRREVRRTVVDLGRKAGLPIEVREVVFLTSMNVITSMLWGSSVGEEERDRIGKEFRKVVDEIIDLLGATNVSDLFPVLAWLDLQGVERRMKEQSVWFDRLLSTIIDRQREIDKSGGGGPGGEVRKKDFLQLMLEVVEKGDPQESLTIDHIKGLFLDLVLGGTDTTTTTVEWAMSEMMNKPEVMRRVREELDAVIGNKVVEESHLSKLHYLDAVVKETLPLHPAVPLLVPHCPSAVCVVGGYTIPKGTKVFINAWAIQRDPSVWEKPTEFKPERFLMETSKLDYYGGNNFSFLPFGSGRRICVGISLATRMMMYMLAELLHSFEWRLEEGAELKLSEKFGILLKKVKPLIAIPTPRFSNLELHD